MAAHPTGSYQEGTLANAIAHYWQVLGLKTKVRLVHRLDKDTSGLILVAKEPYTHHGLVQQLRRRELVREYLALVRGQLREDQGVIEAPIARMQDHGVKRTADPRVRRPGRCTRCCAGARRQLWCGRAWEAGAPTRSGCTFPI